MLGMDGDTEKGWGHWGRMRTLWEDKDAGEGGTPTHLGATHPLLAKSPFLGNGLIKLDFSRAEGTLALPRPAPWGPPRSCPSCPWLTIHPGPGAATPHPMAT